MPVGTTTVTVAVVVRPVVCLLADLWADLKRQRLVGANGIATHLADAGLLRDDLTVEQARDLIWVHIAPEVDGLLVERGWTLDQRVAWLADTLCQSLLPDDSSAPTSRPS